MPPLPPLTGAVKIVVKQTLQGVNVYNVLHALAGISGGFSSADLSALATTFRAAWVTNVIPQQNSALTLTDVTVTDLSSTTGLEASVTGSNTGSGAGGPLPASAAVCWSWKVAERYRGGHPRTYIGGIGTEQISNANTLLSTKVTAHAAAAAAIRTAVNNQTVGPTTWRLGCISYYNAKALRPVPVFREFTSVSVDSRIDSQRRRLGRDR